MENYARIYAQIIDESARHQMGEIIDTMLPSQFDSDLITDVKQDLWLRLLTKKKLSPDISDEDLLIFLKNVKLDSHPDVNMVYVGNID